MTFHWPHAFWLLLVPLVLLASDVFRRRSAFRDSASRIRRAEVRHASLLIHEPAEELRFASRARLYSAFALAAAVVALARPQWGRIEEPVFDQSREIVIALDLSRSMLATDVAPSRLERARLLVTGLLERLKGERVGLVVFSGTAFLQSPLSSDYEILREFLPQLDSASLPEGGTDYDALLDTAVSAFGSSASADRFLVVLSDGEAQTDSWKHHLDAIKAKGIRILGLGVGTAAGSMIPDGEGAFVKDESGAVVLSRLDSSTLRALASETGGVYADASSWVDLSDLIQRTVERGRRGEFMETSRVRLAERFQWPLGASLVLFLLACWRELPVRPKPRTILLTRPPASGSAKLAAGSARLALLAVLLCHVSGLAAQTAGGSATTEPDASIVTRTVARLADSASPSAKDFAALASATADYGTALRGSGRTVAEGAVRDALAAADAGEKLSPSAADWPGLRSRLRALLSKPDSPPPPEQPKPDEKKPSQDKDQKKDDADKQQSKGESPSQPDQSDKKGSGGKDQPPPSSSGPKNKDEQKPGESDSSGSPDSKDDPSRKKSPESAQSAFGDMKDGQPPHPDKVPAPVPEDTTPPPARDMQQVGGVSDRPSNDPARLDPNLVLPLQKLDQVKQGDSPARLFQLLQEPGSVPPAAKKGQTW